MHPMDFIGLAQVHIMYTKGRVGLPSVAFVIPLKKIMFLLTRAYKHMIWACTHTNISIVHTITNIYYYIKNIK